MSILKSTNSGIHGIIANEELLITWLKEIGYDLKGSFYVATNNMYRFLPSIYFNKVYVNSKNKTHFIINISSYGDQNYSFNNMYIIETYSDFLSFKKDINTYINKHYLNIQISEYLNNYL